MYKCKKEGGCGAQVGLQEAPPVAMLSMADDIPIDSEMSVVTS
jgi:hypothetical protein